MAHIIAIVPLDAESFSILVRRACRLRDLYDVANHLRESHGQHAVLLLRQRTEKSERSNSVKRGWGYHNPKNVVQGRNAYGVWISFRDRDPVRAAMIVCGALIGGVLVLAAAIAFGGAL